MVGVGVGVRVRVRVRVTPRQHHSLQPTNKIFHATVVGCSWIGVPESAAPTRSQAGGSGHSPGPRSFACSVRGE